MNHAPGWFGKLHCLGDFASRRLPSAWQQGCDRWLSACMEQSQLAMGDAWLPTYLSSPIWRFAWGPQVVDEAWWFGVLMPSCDSVGRYFPLVLAHTRPKPPEDRFGLDHLEWWWDQAAQAAAASLQPGGSVERFESALADLPPWPCSAPSALQAIPASWGQQWRMPAATGLADLAQLLASDLITRRMIGHSFWWPWRTQASTHPSLLVPGLPRPGQFVTMLGASRPSA